MSLAFVFPGQGSQSIEMLAPLAEVYPIVQQTFAHASDVLGFDLWQLVQQGPADKLNDTQNTQPALLAAGVAIWNVWNERVKGVPDYMPTLMAGHSLGEYTALVCAGAIEFRDAIGLVARRGEFMQQAVPPGEGAMAALLGLGDDAVRSSCLDAAQGEVVSAVNFNAPGQVVIAGTAAAVDRAITLAQQAGAKRAIKLAVSVPSHCRLMEKAADRLSALLEQIDIKSPAIPVINNVNVSIETDAPSIRGALKQQLCNPVRWVETIRNMHENNITRIVECGPGKVLVGLNKRIEKSMLALPVFSPQTLDDAIEKLAQ